MATMQTATEIAARVREGKQPAGEAVRACLERIEQLDGELGAFLWVDREGAQRRADAVDQRVAKGETDLPLAGVPVAVKDNICVAGTPTTCGSRILEKFVAPYEAHVAERLRAAGAIVIGKTNLDEFAMGSSTENSALGVTRNPWNRGHVPGGSSGGSAVAVAAGMVPVALGSDTGGSVRQPASFCGVVGLKPTYGRVSRYGLVAFGSSLDQIGPLARTAEDAALVLGAIAGADARDTTCLEAPVPAYADELAAPLAGTRVGIAREYFGEGLSDETRAAVDAAIGILRANGADVVDVHLPHMTYGVACYYLIAPAEASSNLARYDGVHYGHRAAANDI
ncbi:MAG TPA: amidase family protein, partial [Phycisphaerae bacterium]|nr:amidase family protein [Phycisphaerae bacterium]